MYISCFIYNEDISRNKMFTGSEQNVIFQLLSWRNSWKICFSIHWRLKYYFVYTYLHRHKNITLYNLIGTTCSDMKLVCIHNDHIFNYHSFCFILWCMKYCLMWWGGRVCIAWTGNMDLLYNGEKFSLFLSELNDHWTQASWKFKLYSNLV